MKTPEEKVHEKWRPYLKKRGKVSEKKVEEFKRDVYELSRSRNRD